MKLSRILGNLALGAALLAPLAAHAEFPERPITLVLPMGAGGSHDLHARGITGVISDILGQPMVVKLVPGGAGMKGTKEVAEADPDGYTIIFTHNGFDQIVPQTRDAGFDPLTAFVSVARVNQSEPILCAPGNKPYDTLDAFLLGCPGVIGHPVDAAVIGQQAQFRGEGIGIDDRILLGKQDAVMADSHLFVDSHRFEANRATADDQRLEIFTREGPDPFGIRLAQTAITMDQWIVSVVVILCHWFYLQIETLIRLYQ